MNLFFLFLMVAGSHAANEWGGANVNLSPTGIQQLQASGYVDVPAGATAITPVAPQPAATPKPGIAGRVGGFFKGIGNSMGGFAARMTNKLRGPEPQTGTGRFSRLFGAKTQQPVAPVPTPATNPYTGQQTDQAKQQQQLQQQQQQPFGSGWLGKAAIAGGAALATAAALKLLPNPFTAPPPANTPAPTQPPNTNPPNPFASGPLPTNYSGASSTSSYTAAAAPPNAQTSGASPIDFNGGSSDDSSKAKAGVLGKVGGFFKGIGAGVSGAFGRLTGRSKPEDADVGAKPGVLNPGTNAVLPDLNFGPSTTSPSGAALPGTGPDTAASSTLSDGTSSAGSLAPSTTNATPMDQPTLMKTKISDATDSCFRTLQETIVVQEALMFTEAAASKQTTPTESWKASRDAIVDCVRDNAQFGCTNCPADSMASLASDATVQKLSQMVKDSKAQQ